MTYARNAAVTHGPHLDGKHMQRDTAAGTSSAHSSRVAGRTSPGPTERVTREPDKCSYVEPSAIRAPSVEPLIVTKLTRPRLPERMILRPRLFDLLNRGSARPVTVVSGFAGAGKTFLVASWVDFGRPPAPVAWVSLDHDDNDPTRFWSHVLAAMRSTGASPADNPLAELVPPYRPDDNFYLRLTDGLARLRQPVVVVLDDLHQVTEPAVRQGLATLLRCPAPMLRLVLLTRADPQLPLQRLRLQGQLTEIRNDDLAFTLPEAADLFAQSGLDMTPSEITKLLERTEGWAAGLRLAAMSLEGSVAAGGTPSVPHQIDQFTGAEQTVIDYLLVEVLSGLPAADREFLLRISLVAEVCADLAEALTGRPDGQCLLESLERSGVFVVGVGAQRMWFRFHHLFRDVLRHELLLRDPGLMAIVHRAAAAWLGEHGEPIRALRHAIEAGDWAFVDALTARSLLPHILGPNREALCGLLSRLPEDQTRSHAGISLGAAFRAFHLRDLDGTCSAAAHSARLVEGLDGDRSAPVLTAIRLLEMAAAQLRGDVGAVVEAATSAEELLAQIPPGVVPAAAYRGLISVNRGVALLWTDNFDQAEQDLTAGVKSSSAIHLDPPHITALGHLSLVAVMRGWPKVAFDLGQSAVEIAERCGWATETQAATAYLALALCEFEWDETDAAHEFLDRAAAAVNADQSVPVTVAIHVARARFRLAEGNPCAARSALDHARHWHANQERPAFLARLLTVEEAEIDLATGHPERVRDRLGSLDHAGVSAGSRERARVRFARALLALGESRQAEVTVGPLLADERADRGPAVEAWLVVAAAADRLREDARALDALSRALDLAAPEGRRRPFMTADLRLHEVLVRYATIVDTHRAFLAALLADVDKERKHLPLASLNKALTDREVAVLRCLPTLLTYVELAEQIGISVNTVKAHLKSLYGKLGVRSRRKAVQRGRDLGLL